MKNIFIPWLILGLVAAIIMGIIQADTFEWNIRSIVGLYAGGLLWVFPVMVIYGVVNYFVQQRKEKQRR